MLTLSYIFLVTIFWISNCEEQYCSIESVGHCKEEKKTNIYNKDLNKRFNKYYHALEEAEQNYKPCNNTNNGCYKDVIIRDLKTFKQKGINKDLINTSKNRGTFYQIIGGNVYRQTDCMFPSRCAGIEHFLLKLAPDLPDVDLVINTRDYPQTCKHFGGPLPIFSFSKTPEYYDITYPAWSFWEGGPAISLYPRGLGRWDEHRVSLDKASKNAPWSKKEGKGFFRGSRTSSERDNLVLLSRSKPDLVDAQYTKNQAWKSDEDTLYAAPASEAPLESHCKYKYLFNFKGVAASFRHKHLFLCQSLVFHVGDEWTEFYYDAMVPWIHYIPIPKDADQIVLEEIMQFAKENDELSKKIADQGKDFIWNNLRMSDIVHFWKKLIRRYSKLLTYKPSLDETLIRIEKKERS
ncbi:PREDICTED: O-glucosyltransferase rumi homolog [Dufourea novaeangliae]|uniref:O-glucosyltransferase rumi like protein n=1 Tax=Dufourea novaeangliae TaxID=178035 RepID=A0A154PC08_DUFNO|nr:PREDICTED: O-glucosyltransferase rumi homolog [Dufourea novaeangliae]KZC09459.1 O-glucosyltransferase rumi like protein [Dufourea novaeangliae]